MRARKDSTSRRSGTTRIKTISRIVNPGFTLGGYLIKDRLWIFAARHRIQLTRTHGELRAVSRAGQRGPSTRTVNTYYSNARLDFLATQKIRLYGSWAYATTRYTGPSLPQADDVHGQFNSSSTNNPDIYNGGIGYVNPNVIYNTGADISITPNLVATTRFGYFYQDTQSRGLPVGIRYLYRDTNYSYHTGNAPALADTDGAERDAVAIAFVNSTGHVATSERNSATVSTMEAVQLQPGPGLFQDAGWYAQLQVRLWLQPWHQRRA